MERVGKYELSEKLGEGGFGRVWKALDTDLEVWRALKEPYDQSPELETELKEARVQAKMDHPGLVRILSTERIDGRFFLVTEYVEGQTLRQWLHDRGEIDAEAADRMLVEILSGLAHAHDQGIVHLDLKPENIFVTVDGHTKIGDFGLARIVDRTMATMTSVKGTLHYMAPEQLDGKAGPSADVWALGAIAYELYTGEFAVAGQTQGQIIRNVAEGVVRDIGAVPDTRRSWVEKLLTKDPGQRFASAGEALAALQELIGPPAEFSVELQRGARWGLWLAPSVVLAVLLAVSCGIYGVWAGIWVWPTAEKMFLWGEAAPESHRPGAEFFALPPPGQLDAAWQHADAGEYPLAYGAAQALIESAPEPAIRAEALYLKAVLAGRYMESPWHAVLDLRRYETDYPEGAHAVAAGIMMGELYVGLGRVAEGAQVLDALVRRFPRDPLLGDVLTLVDRCEEWARRGTESPRHGVKAVGALLAPNNPVSLVLSFAAVGLFLGPAVLWFAVGVVSQGNRRNPLPWILVIGFLAAFAAEVYVNQGASVSARQQLLQVFENLRGTIGG